MIKEREDSLLFLVSFIRSGNEVATNPTCRVSSFNMAFQVNSMQNIQQQHKASTCVHKSGFIRMQLYKIATAIVRGISTLIVYKINRAGSTYFSE